MNLELEALGTIRLEAAPTKDEVWESSPEHHVDSLHPEVSRRLMHAMQSLDSNGSPSIAVVRGQRGSGKTHVVGWTRQRIQAQGGFFFYIKLVTGQGFWESAVGSLVDSLYGKDDGGQAQLLRLLDDLARQAGLDPATRAAVTGTTNLTRADVDAFVRGIRRLDRQVGNEAADTARALVLVASSGDAVEVGNAYLALTELEPQDRTAWGLSARRRPAQVVLRDLTRLFALSGPLVFAFDQIDNLVQVVESGQSTSASRVGRAADRLASEIAAGLMELREETRRTLLVVACDVQTWELIRRTALRSALDRVGVLPELGQIPDAGTAGAILVRRFRAGYASVGFTPPYPTWPVTDGALAEAAHRYTARRFLLRIGDHVNERLRSGVAAELTSLAEHAPPPAAPPAAGHDELTELFRQLRADADDVAPLDKDAEDRLMPALLSAGLQSLVVELGGDPGRFTVDSSFGRRAALHARLRYTVDEASENEIHWSFRAIAMDNARGVLTRIRNAVAESGLTAGLAGRRLILVRGTGFPTGRETQKAKDDFDARGGLSLPITGADLRTLSALRTLLEKRPLGLAEWLRRQRPAAGTELFASVVADLRSLPGVDVAADPGDDGPAPVPEEPGPAPADIVIGTTLRGGTPFTVAPRQLRKHTVMIGASGSGKTVLIKRLVEQCALRGISTIVLDPNDDLARLGDPWPVPPGGWTQEHDREARQYFSDTEVKVWTPGLQRGRPLSFPPIPDFGPVLADADDFARLLSSTVASLAPQARIRGDSARATQQLGVLRRALELYVRGGGRTTAGLLDLLAEPSSDIVNSRTRRFAVEMADTLQAATESDPLLAETGTPTDPGMLLTPTSGRSARVSVISFVGLEKASQARFVSRLQGELFSWFKAHPTTDDRLGGLLVMDEAGNFVPPGGARSSATSTVELIRQIRKYGLGIVLGAQAPKGIHHEAIGNTANQFLGALRVPAQIDAAKEMAQARNSAVDDIGALGTGTFYAAGEGTGFRKIQAPICLTHHAGPLTEEEIVERSRRDDRR